MSLAAIATFLASPLGKLALWGVGIAFVMLAFFGAKAGYDNKHEAIGAARVTAKDAPVMALCTEPLRASRPPDCAAAIRQAVADVAQLKQNNAALTAMIGQQNAALAKLGDATAKARAAATAANKEADDNAVFYTERLKGLRENLDHPSGDPNADTDRILRALAIDRRGRLHGE